MSKISSQGEVNNLVGKCFKNWLYRPTVVGVILDQFGRVLVTSSPKHSDWAFPQGGVKQGEDIVHALCREIMEEIRMQEAHLSVRKYLWTQQLPFPDNRSHDGFSLGKEYYFFLVDYLGPEELQPNPDDVSDYVWATPADLGKYVSEKYTEKRSMLQKHGLLLL